MIKVMLVEDDKSLREIYGVRLLAEGYNIVTASDGEEALAVAIKERPGLIIADVMMPKISGFDMLDILRSTPETKDIKVIIMTALGSEDQRQRGRQMGADRFLVKSQVGIEDVVRVVHEVLGDTKTPAGGITAPPLPATAAPTTPSAPATNLAAAPAAAQSAPAAPTPTAPAPRPQQLNVPQRQQTVDGITAPTSAAPVLATPAAAVPAPTPAATAEPNSTMPVSSTSPPAPSTRQRIIQPIGDPTTKVNINDLLDKELAKEAGLNPANSPQVESTTQEKAEVQQQLNTFTTPTQSPSPTSAAPPATSPTNVAPPAAMPPPTFGPPAAPQV